MFLIFQSLLICGWKHVIHLINKKNKSLEKSYLMSLIIRSLHSKVNYESEIASKKMLKFPRYIRIQVDRFCCGRCEDILAPVGKCKNDDLMAIGS